MARIDISLMPVVTDLSRGMRELDVPFAVVGALVPELLLDTKPQHRTNDADIVVTVERLADFEALKDHLTRHGFTRARLPHRLTHRDGGLVDILPYSDAIAADGQLELDEGVVLNMAGFAHVVPNAIPTTIDNGPTLPVAPVPLYVLLKLVAFSDRGARKDLLGVLHCLEHYAEDDDRRFVVEHEGIGVNYEYTTAFLLGLDARRFLDPPTSEIVGNVLDLLGDPESVTIGIVAREKSGSFVYDDDRTDIFERFRWFRFGIGL